MAGQNLGGGSLPLYYCYPLMETGSNNKGGDYLDPRDPLKSGDLKSVWVSRRALRFDHRIDTHPHEGGNMDGLFVKKRWFEMKSYFQAGLAWYTAFY